ncbi:MAG: BatD family protein [Thiobacillus sp.]|nr:BatD family protein [Thiobacillus sp.]
MVSKLLFLAVLANGMAHAASFTARLDKPAITLGEPVSLTLEAKGLSLDELDITPITSHFDVAARTLSRGTNSETLVLTLYPRGAGVLNIPSLQVNGLRTAVRALNVADGSETLSRVTASWSLAPVSPLVNQPTRLTLSICDDGSLQWQRPVLPTSAGRLLRVLGEAVGEGKHGEATCTLHQFHWSLLATQSGSASLGIPMIDANRFGLRLRFPGPGVSYQARALPAWLPGATPPVEPEVRVESLPLRWPLNRPLIWRFQVTGGYSVEDLKALLELQLRESPALGLYPPLIEAVAMDDSASPLSRYDVTLYFQPRKRGELKLPVVRLPWYDATRGQLASTELKARPLTVFDPRWKQWGVGAGGIVGALLLGALVWQARRMIRWRIARRQGLQRIRQANSVDALAHAVRQFSLTDQSAAPSLGEWMQRVQLATLAGDVADAVSQLEQHQFGRASYTLPELQQAFLQALVRVRPK